MPNPQISGRKLRQLREKLSLTMRDVHDASKFVAKAKRNRRFLISLSVLSQIERGVTAPTIYRVYTLAFAYNVPM
jgi:transcriptional regulator with XRE-family HTH domain